MTVTLFASETRHRAIGAVRDEGPMPYRRGTATMVPGRIEVVYERTIVTPWLISSIEIGGVRVDGHTAGRDVTHRWTDPTQDEIESDMPEWARAFIDQYVPVGEIHY